MKATVVCGMLGSGKTTFLTEALRNTRERVVVLVNDFGQMGIDGELLSESGVPTIELPSGCVCCTLRFDLVTTLNRIVAEQSPDHIMVEPSGVASPSGVLEALQTAGIDRTSVVGILDATEFIDMYESEMYGNFLLDQVCQSDVLLVNKSDLAEPETRDATVALASRLNPGAVVLATVQARLDDPFNLPSSTKGLVRTPTSGLHFETFSAGLSADQTEEAVVRLFEELLAGHYGDVIRAKSLFNGKDGGVRMDLASGRVDRGPLERTVAAPRIVLIGRNLALNELKRALPRQSDS